MQHRPRGQRTSSLNRILQLPHIPRPVILRSSPAASHRRTSASPRSPSPSAPENASPAPQYRPFGSATEESADSPHSAGSKDPSENFPCSTICARSRFVAASTLAEIGFATVDPTGRTSFSCSARSSFACRSSGNSPISSRNTVPLSAEASNPSFARSAPVNAPFTCPNSSLSISVGTSDPQSTVTNGFAAFGPLKWIDRATSSLPVPLSPRIKTGCVEYATFDRIRYSFSISGERPTSPPIPCCVLSRSRSNRLCTSSSSCCAVRSSTVVSSSSANGFVR